MIWKQVLLQTLVKIFHRHKIFQDEKKKTQNYFWRHKYWSTLKDGIREWLQICRKRVKIHVHACPKIWVDYHWIIWHIGASVTQTCKQLQEGVNLNRGSSECRLGLKSPAISCSRLVISAHCLPVPFSVSNCQNTIYSDRLKMMSFLYKKHSS